jgi:SAM-dependent methyltransferase
VYYQRKKPSSVLEIGSYHWSLLTLDVFCEARRVACNTDFDERSRQALTGLKVLKANSNALPLNDDEFDCVVSCSVFEHDRYFWKSVSEVRRILKPGGLFVVGTPIYMKLPTDCNHTTLTYARHGYAYNADFYRFSEQAVREVLLEGLVLGPQNLARRYPNPYLVATGIKKA